MQARVEWTGSAAAVRRDLPQQRLQPGEPWISSSLRAGLSVAYYALKVLIVPTSSQLLRPRDVSPIHSHLQRKNTLDHRSPIRTAWDGLAGDVAFTGLYAMLPCAWTVGEPSTWVFDGARHTDVGDCKSVVDGKSGSGRE